MLNDSHGTHAHITHIVQECRLSETEVRRREALWLDCLKEFHDVCQVSEAIEDISAKTMDAMTAYLAGALSPEGCALIEKMLREFPGFRLVYADLIAAWQAPSVEREVSEAEVDAAYARFRSRAGLRPSSRQLS